MRDGWMVCTVADLAVERGLIGGPFGSSLGTKDYVDEGVPVIRGGNLGDGMFLDLADTVFVREEKARELRRNLAEPGDVILTQRGTLGQVGLVPSEPYSQYVVSQSQMRLRVDPAKALPQFVYRLFRSSAMVELIKSLNTATANPHINLGICAALQVAIPPLNEQRRIADVLAQLDAVADALSTVVLNTATAEFALRFEAFDNHQIEAVPLRSLCDDEGIQIGPFGSQLHASDYVDDGVPTVMPKDIVDGRIDSSSIARVGRDDWQRLGKHHLEANDIVLPRRGDLAKRALVTPEQSGWLCGTGSVRVRVAKADPKAVFEALSSEYSNRWLHDNAVGITMPNLNTSIVSSIPIRLPADGGVRAVEVLRALAEFRNSCESERRSVEASRIAIATSLLSGEHEIPGSYDALLERVP